MTGGIKVFITEEQGKFIKDSVANGFSLKYIGKELKISAPYISKYCKENNIVFELMRYSQEEDQILKDHTNLENKEIQKFYLPYRTLKSISQRFKVLGIRKVVGKQWLDNDLIILKNNFPNKSMQDLLILLPNYSNREIDYMAKKLCIYKTEQRKLDRYLENGQLAKTHIYKVEKEDIILKLLKKYDGNVHLVIKYFQQDYNITKYPKKKIYEFLVSRGFIDPVKWYLYLDIWCPKNPKLTWEQSFELYTTNFNDVPLGIGFDKETTKKLFIYWAKKNNYSLDKEDLLSSTFFRETFIKSKLEVSIRKNYKYTYNFIADLLEDDSLKPYHLSIQVPDKYWHNQENLFEMIDEKIIDLINDKIIDECSQILTVPMVTILEYFPILPFHRGIKDKLVKYLISRNIRFDEKSLRYFDGIYFDSKEELMVYKKIKNFGYKIDKVSRIEKYFNEQYNERYIPDFKILINDKIYIAEYFGLYNRFYKKRYTTEYEEKSKRKTEYFSNNYDFIPFFPDDLKRKGEGLFQKLEERRNIG